MQRKVRMASSSRWLAAAAALVSDRSACCQGSSAQQIEIDNNFKYNSGQDVQPVFEGWSHRPDGGFAMHFGYLNRNWVQELLDSGRTRTTASSRRSRPRTADVLLHAHAAQHVHRDRAEGLGQEGS